MKNKCIVCTEYDCTNQRCIDILVDIEEIKTKTAEELIRELYP